jgi:hypothetical protein
MSMTKGRWRAAALVVVAVAAAAALLLLRDSDDEPGWISAPGRAIDVDSCAELPQPDLGFSRLPRLREPVFDLGSSGPRFWVGLRGVDGRLVRTGQYYGVAVEDTTRRRVTRDWWIKARMLALDEQGAVVEEISHDKTGPGQEGRGTNPQLRMRVGEEPGFYRLDLRVSNAGRHSGRYGFYIKAESPRGEARLAIAGDRFRPGQRMGMRLENLGTERITYGLDGFLEREVRGEWRPVPDEDAVPLIGFMTEGGEASSCFSYELEPDLPPGRYRLVKEVSVHAEPQGYHDHLLTAEFQVTR